MLSIQRLSTPLRPQAYISVHLSQPLDQLCVSADVERFGASEVHAPSMGGKGTLPPTSDEHKRKLLSYLGGSGRRPPHIVTPSFIIFHET